MGFGDIRDRGELGVSVHKTAQALHQAKLITDTEFDELKNKDPLPVDQEIAGRALNKLTADMPNAMQLLMAIPKLQNDLLVLQAQDSKVSGVQGNAPADQLNRFADLITQALRR
jgi:hypothetical protein